jgi:SAM-dependent methyltransferase
LPNGNSNDRTVPTFLSGGSALEMNQMKNHSDNPWLRVPAADYEEHMNLPEVNQLATLSTIFAEIYARFKPASLAVPGCATGNGFEHIDPAVTRSVIGIDINGEYLDIARKRFPRLATVLTLIQAPIESCFLAESSIELVHAGLIFEYIDPGTGLERIAAWLAPDGVFSVVLQLPCASGGAVTDTRVSSVKILEPVIALVPPYKLESLAAIRGLHTIESDTVALPGGKRFYVGIFRKAPHART